jgi:hypothetical protein
MSRRHERMVAQAPHLLGRDGELEFEIRRCAAAEVGLILECHRLSISRHRGSAMSGLVDTFEG